MATKVASAGGPLSNPSSSSTVTPSNSTNLPLKLSQLQNLIKRDPPAYKEDYDTQFRRLTSLIDILLLSPNADPSPKLVELIQFIAAVSSSSFKGKESDEVARVLMGLLVGPGNVTGIGDAGNHISASALPLVNDSLPLPALQLHREIRKACVSALILMRNKGAIPPLILLQLFFQLMSVVPDKNLRESLYHHIVNDIRNINKASKAGKHSPKHGNNGGKRDEKLNRTILSFFHRIVSASANESVHNNNYNNDTSSNNSTSAASFTGEDSPTDFAAKRATQITCDLYRHQVWTDERSIHILATAATHPSPSVMSRALRFFLNIEETMAFDKKSSEEDQWHGVQKVDLHLHSKKTKSRQRMVEKQLKNRQRKQNEREGKTIAEREDKGVEASRKLFPAIELLNDAQGTCELLLKRIKSSGSKYKFETKMLMLNFVTRVVGNHELLLLPLYPLLQRYMGGHQRDVTAILAYAVQSCHEYVPPQEIYGVLKTIAHNFITERCSEEQMAVGINAARAICARVPSVLAGDDEEDAGGKGENGGSTVAISASWDVEAFVRDLAGYAKHRDRSVSIAGRGWVNFIREVYPSLLQGKDRGLVGAGLHKSGEKPLRYGEFRAASGVEGADLLAAYEAAKKKKLEQGEDVESDGDDDDSESGWVEMKGGDESDVEVGDDSDEEVEKEEEEDEIEVDESDEEAPDLVLLGEESNNGDDNGGAENEGDRTLDLSKLSEKERAKLKQEISSTRIFTTAEFVKMRKLVERQQQARRDPRLAAKLKRAIARGEEYDDISDFDSDEEVDSDDDNVHISGAVNPTDIMAEAKRKRMSKAEKLEKILEGRQKWESKERAGGSTNTEKKRKKNFAMSKFSFSARQKVGEKETAKKGKKREQLANGRDAKKRRRKF
mmetsp:Transcript_16710/g.33991  ORF Transcript_16710/g.33991 Transcript_16710/m.33991 type:complete len:896 (-) Transcript_16710:104-2791(-)